jgi:hypothetical protein
MLTLLLASASLLALGETAFAETSRPMSEMHGGCENYKMNLKNEMALWEKQPVKELVPGAKTQLALEPQAMVKFLKDPQKKFTPQTELYAAVIRFHVPTSGTYRLSIGKKAWADVLDTAKMKIVPAATFEMQTKCDKIFKAVEFALEANKEYALQINGNAARTLDVLITKAN